MPRLDYSFYPFPYYGAKTMWVKWLLPYLDVPHDTYVEPFGGSGVVLFSKPQVPCEVYNDKNKAIVTFFRVLRDHKEEFINKLILTPISRFEFKTAIDIIQNPNNHSDIEIAWAFYTHITQCFNGDPSTRSWKFLPGKNFYLSLQGYPDRLIKIAARLATVALEHDDALNIIKRFDTPNTLFYCDPPYPHEARGNIGRYQYEMSNEDHIALAETLHNIKGKAVLSGYRCDLLNSLYSDWRSVDLPAKYSGVDAFKEQKLRTETIWLNFDPGPGPLFSLPPE